MDGIKIVFIYGKEKLELGIIEGKIDKVGHINDGRIHASYLLEFASNNYPEVDIFKRLNIRHEPEVISLFYTQYFNHIVFLNTTSFNSEGKITHGKTGTFLLPNDISLKQKESLYEFLNMIDDYSVTILYNVDIVDGIFDGKEIRPISGITPSSLFDKYFQMTNNTSKTI